MGSKPIKIEDLLPYHDVIIGLTEDQKDRLTAQRHRAAHQSMVDALISKRTKNDG